MTMTVATPPLQPTPGLRETTAHPPRRIAVFGSVSAERPPHAALEAPASATRAVLERVFAEISAQAPLIAQPILDRAVGDGMVTREERDELLSELADPQATAEARAARTRVRAGARAVLGEAFSAIRRAAPGVAEPILRQAVADARLTPAQSRRILERLRSSPAAAFRGAHAAHPGP